MAATSPGMRVVELVEDDGASGAAVPGVAGAPALLGAAPPSPPRRRPRPLSAAVVALALGAVVGDATADARTRAAVAALAVVPGVVTTLDRPLVELWRGDPTLRPDLGDAGSRLVGVMGERGAADVVGLDPATGAVVWRTAVRGKGALDPTGGVRCVVPDAPSSGGAATGAGGASTPYAVCVVDRAAPHAADGSLGRVPEDRLLTLDARDGAVVADRTVPRSTVLAALGPDVVTGSVDDDGHVHVTRTDPLGEHVRWAFVGPRRLPRTHLSWATRIAVQDGVVVVDEAEGWALSGDGEVLHSWRTATWPSPDARSQVVGGGRFLVRPDPQGGAAARTHVVDLRTGRSFGVPGQPLTTHPDDGTADRGVLVRAAGSGDLAAVDPGGRTSWRTAGGVQGAPLVLDGRLVRLGPTDLAGIDPRTGRVVWSTPLRRTARASLVTDGRLAVVTRLDPDDGVVLSALGLDDGRPRWSVDLADDVSALLVRGHRVFGWTGDQVVALGPAPG